MHYQTEYGEYDDDNYDDSDKCGHTVVTNIVIHDHDLSSLHSKIHQMTTIYHHHHQYQHHHHHHLQLFLFSGKLPTVSEYNKYAVEINKTAADTFRYLNFDKLPDFVATSKDVDLGKL